MKKLFKCNEDGIAEWCVASDKLSAYIYMQQCWGESTMKEYEDEYLSDNKGSTREDFIENFFIEEDPEKEFRIDDDGPNGESVTKKVYEWLEDISEIPSYFCCQDF